MRPDKEQIVRLIRSYRREYSDDDIRQSLHQQGFSNSEIDDLMALASEPAQKWPWVWIGVLLVALIMGLVLGVLRHRTPADADYEAFRTVPSEQANRREDQDAAFSPSVSSDPAAQTATQRIELTVIGGHSLWINIPADWNVRSRLARLDLPATYEIRDPMDRFDIRITPMDNSGGTAGFGTAEFLRKVLEAGAKISILPKAAEEPVFREFENPGIRGVYFFARDKAPGPGEFEYVMSAVIGNKDLVATMTMLYRQDSQQTRRLIEDIIRSVAPGSRRAPEATAKPDAAQPQAQKNTFAYPGKSWGLAVDLSGYLLEKPIFNSKYHRFLVRGRNDHTDMIVSIFLEDFGTAVDSNKCRQYYWPKVMQSPVPLSKVVQVSMGQLALGGYMIEKVADIPVKQLNMNAYLGHDQICVDIHLSKTSFTPKDQKLFDAVLQSVSIVE